MYQMNVIVVEPPLRLGGGGGAVNPAPAPVPVPSSEMDRYAEAFFLGAVAPVAGFGGGGAVAAATIA